jgi:hypothetical protein
MTRTIKTIGIISLIFLLAGAIMKLFYIPNQLIILGAGFFSFSLIILPAFLVFKLKRSAYTYERILHIAGFLFCFIFIIAFVIILQRQSVPFVVITICSGILILGYFIYLIAENRDVPVEKIKWLFVSAYLSAVILVFLSLPFEMQGADKFYNPAILHPSYSKAMGPVIFIDQGHNNFHTLNGRLRSTAKLLRRDGYRALSYEGQFESSRLKEGKILMIVNAVHESNLEEWTLPTPSAFSEDEIKAVTDWVYQGGSLFLVADHMPFAGAASKLASQFGFILHNGFALDTIRRDDYFFRSDSTLHNNIITNGSNADERVDSILTFTGHAFEIPEDATPIMTFPDAYLQWCPDTAWRFQNTIPESITGYSQGAFKKFGDGRVVILGEAMMITAQLTAGLSWKKIGMNSPQAPYNHKLLLNITRWLDSRPE